MAERSTVVVAIDFGATSMRVCRVDLDARPIAVDVVRRCPHHPVASTNGPLRWDWTRLMAEVDRGLSDAVACGPVASIGVDTWGVDYGLLDDSGRLVAPPVSYRDARTSGWRTVVDRIGAAELWSMTGVQLQPFNTIFQLAAHDSDELGRARHLLLLPELVVHHLTSEMAAERTSAGTTGLVDIATGTWSEPLVECVGLAPGVLAPILPAGTSMGTWNGTPVHLVAGHDTASAVAAMAPAPAPGAAFASSGTWLLVGQERAQPDTSAAARKANLSNEIGAAGGFRLLANLAGWWLLDGCREAWANGPDPQVEPIDELLQQAGMQSAGAIFDPRDARFLNPDDMLGEVTDAMGLDRETPPPIVARAILDSMAWGTAAVLDALGGATELHVFGGGAASAAHLERLAAGTGIPVYAGPTEATALGNALVQGIAIGRFSDLADARRSLADPASPNAT